MKAFIYTSIKTDRICPGPLKCDHREIGGFHVELFSTTTLFLHLIPSVSSQYWCHNISHDIRWSTLITGIQSQIFLFFASKLISGPRHITNYYCNPVQAYKPLSDRPFSFSSPVSTSENIFILNITCLPHLWCLAFLLLIFIITSITTRFSLHLIPLCFLPG